MIEYQTIQNWVGYENKEDITNMPINALRVGSQNVLVQEGKKIIPSGGYSLLGQAKTVNIGIRSTYDDFVNVQGIPLPIRETPNVNAQLRDVIEVWYQNTWNQITPNTNTKPLGLHVYSFFEWYDDIQKKRKVGWVNGNSGNDAINTWNGAVATVSGTTVNTISIASLTWEALGFDAVGSLVINGLVFAYTGGSTTGTLTGVTPDPTGLVAPGDLAWDLYKTQSGIQNNAPYGDFNFDICSMLYNQVYYADYTRPNTLVSQIGNPARITSTGFSGSGLNNGSFSGTYTGPLNASYKVVIRRSVPLTNNDPALPGQIIFTGPGGNVIVFDASGYTDVNDINVYEVKIVQQGGYGTPLGYNAYKNGNQVNAPGTATALQTVGGVPLVGPNANYTFPVDDGILFYLDPFYDNFLNAAATPTVLQPGASWTFTYGVSDFIDIFRIDPDGTETQIGSDIRIIAGTPIALGDAFGLSVTFDTARGHNTGDTFTVLATAEVSEGYRDFTFTQPIRLPGEGATLLADRPVKGLKPQEDKMEIFCFGGLMYETEFSLAADLSAETLTIKKFKSEPQNEPVSNELITHIKNSLVYLNINSEIDELGRVEQIVTQQTRTISDKIKRDLQGKDYTDGHDKFFNNFFIISVPQELRQYYYDFVNGYWQPPQTAPIGRLSVIDGKLVGHSYNTNESYLLFDGLTANGMKYVSRSTLPYNSYDLRYHTKDSTKIFIEGYKNTPTVLKIHSEFDFGGCAGVFNESISPDQCSPRDNSSLGKTDFGKHGLGTNIPSDLPKFHAFIPHSKATWYENSISIECDTLEQQYGILAIGTDAQRSGRGNSQNTTSD